MTNWKMDSSDFYETEEAAFLWTDAITENHRAKYFFKCLQLKTAIRPGKNKSIFKIQQQNKACGLMATTQPVFS